MNDRMQIFLFIVVPLRNSIDNQFGIFNSKGTFSPHELKASNITDGTDDEHGNVKGCITSAHDGHGQEVEAIGAKYHVPDNPQMTRMI